MNKLQKVEEYIRKACPETMELSFGCRIQFKPHNPKFTYVIAKERSVFGAGGKVWELVADSRMIAENKKEASRIWDTEIFELLDIDILGHELRLEHVLRAINASADGFTNRTLNMSGLFGWEMQTGNTGVRYDLTKPLKNQSPELIDFLFNIFYPNE